MKKFEDLMNVKNEIENISASQAKEKNKLNQETKILIDQTIEFFQKIYSDNCRVYIRPSGTEPVIRVLVEAKNHKKVHSLSNEITNKLFLEINKITN